MTRTSHIEARQKKSWAAFRSRANRTATTSGISKPKHDLQWVLSEIDGGSIRATAAQRAALAAVLKEVYAVPRSR